MSDGTRELQAQILANLSEMRQAPENSSSSDNAQVTCTEIKSALEQFSECVRYLNTRRSKGAVLTLDSESAVQDTVYLMLRPWVKDLVPENPTEKNGNRYSLSDFSSKEARTMLEVKFIRDKDHGKNISSELHDDIEMYRHHPDYDNVLFFIYDPDSQIPDTTALEKTITESRSYSGIPLYCHVVIR